MIQRTPLAIAALVLDGALFMTVLVPILIGHVPRRWRRTVSLLALVAFFNVAEALVFMWFDGPRFAALEPAVHLAMVFALTALAFVFKVEVTQPQRLLENFRGYFPDMSAEFDLLPAPVAFMAPDGTIRRANRCAEELLDRPASELEGTSAVNLAEREADRRRLQGSIESFVSSKGVLNSEVEYWTSTSTGSRLLRWRRAAQYDDDGNIVGIVTYGEDITEKRRTEERLNLETYVLDKVHDAVAVRALDGRRLYLNESAYAMLGMTKEEFLDLPYYEWLTPETRATVARHLQNAERHGEDIAEVVARRKDGSLLPLELRSQLIEFEGEPASLTVCRDITLRYEAQDLMKRLAFTDTLTGLPNRRCMQDHLAEELDHLGRSLESLSVLYIDLDNLKAVNDSLGHEAGDRLVVKIAARLRDVIGTEDLVGRVGGDEFVVILRDSDALHSSDEVAARVQEALERPLQLDGHELRIRASIGVAACIPGMRPEDAIRNADRAMYVAKRAGGGRFFRHSAVMDEEFLEAFKLKNDLARAVERNEFELAYQPVVNALTGEPVAAEALLRWRHPSRGLLFPDTFIHLAEENGSIREIGRWVIAEACRTLSALRAQGLALERVSVNVSPAQLVDSGFVDHVRAALEDASLDASSLELEITEALAIERHQEIEDVFAHFGDVGIRMALDDFGVGHSSLERLRHLPISTLKIDRTFVADLCHSTSAHPIIETILVLAHNLKLNVVAEGVESECQADYLASAGCCELQGYAFARPVDARTLLEVCLAGVLEADPCERLGCRRSERRETEAATA